MCLYGVGQRFCGVFGPWSLDLPWYTFALLINVKCWRMAHVCNRESCPPTSVSGPKAQCFSCKKQCFLSFYGFSMSQVAAYNQSTDQNNEKVKPFMSLSNIQFICTACLSQPMAQQALNESISMSTPKAEKGKIKDIISEVLNLQEQFVLFQASSNQMNDKLDSIEFVSIENEWHQNQHRSRIAKTKSTIEQYRSSSEIWVTVVGTTSISADSLWQNVCRSYVSKCKRSTLFNTIICKETT